MIYVAYTGGKKLKFETSKKIDKWVRRHIAKGCESRGAAGEHFIYEFLPTGIIEC